MAIPTWANRHDWAWVNPIAAGWVSEPAAADWLRQGRPLVVATQSAPLQPLPSLAVLGIAAPRSHPAYRARVQLPPGAIRRVARPPLLAALLPRLPRRLQAAARALMTALQGLGVTVRVYGSLGLLGWAGGPVLEGCAIIREESDLDLLLEPSSAAEAIALLERLQSLEASGASSPLNGELMRPDGAAVNWREAARALGLGLTSCLASCPSVLVKSLQGTRLMPLADFLGGYTIPEAWGGLASQALWQELRLSPKPGLVCPADSGSHDDMTASTFESSRLALSGMFAEAFRMGQQLQGLEPPDSAEQAAELLAPLFDWGRAAEAEMLIATGGINTHRGAIFSMGFLSCAAGAQCPLEDSQPGPWLRLADLPVWLRVWAGPLMRRLAAGADSPASALARAHRLRCARLELAAGLPVLFEDVLPTLLAAVDDEGLLQEPQWFLRQALLAAMARVDDTNLLRRGGLGALRQVQAEARKLLKLHALGDCMAADQAYRGLCEQLRQRWLSPGGSADLLSSGLLLQAAYAHWGVQGADDLLLALDEREVVEVAEAQHA